MPARHAQTGAPSARTWALGVVGALVAIVVALFASAPAGAVTTTVKAQLSLTGLASASNPLGGSELGVHPGDTVTFEAASAPTAGLDKLGLGGLVGDLLNGVATFQVTADFSHLPGGHANTTLSGSKTVSFHFSSAGTYHFTWTAQSLTPALLGGTTVSQIQLNGNELAQAGVKLNASNQYVGSVVAAKNPPSGGLSVQLPSVAVAPSAPVVGQLPTVSIPGVTLPTVGTSVPDLLPGGGKSSGTTGSSSGSSASASPTYSYKAPAVSVPQEVVPQGDGGAVYAGGGGFRLDVGGAGSNQQLTSLSPALGGLVGSPASSGSAASSGGSGGTANGSSQGIDLASSPGAPSGQLPVLLAILAVVALAVVAGTYARLYLLGRSKPTS